MNGNVDKNFLSNLIRMHDPSAEDCNASNLQVDSWESSNDMDAMWECDTSPNSKGRIDAPTYSNDFSTVLQVEGQEVKTNTNNYQRNSCFNCLGNHLIMDCPQPRDQRAITKNRREFMNKSSGFFRQNSRYHLGEDQIYSHMVPGQISKDLRRALGLSKNQLPLHIYRMRMFGYPPAWLEDARIERSGIALYLDSHGSELTNPGDEEGEIILPGSKDTYNVDKIHEFPGFNALPDKETIDESRYYCCPPISWEQSKEMMVKNLELHSATASAYKKLSSIPMLPTPDEVAADDSVVKADSPEQKGCSPKEEEKDVQGPCISPSLEDLEAQKQSLMAELESKLADPDPLLVSKDEEEPGTKSPKGDPLLVSTDINEPECMSSQPDLLLAPSTITVQHIEVGTPRDRSSPYSRTPSTPCTKIGTVKQIDQGTPILKSASPFSLLPSPDKFSEGICDVINFENLPGSFGHYKRMNQVIHGVRDHLKRQ